METVIAFFGVAFVAFIAGAWVAHHFHAVIDSKLDRAKAAEQAIKDAISKP